MGKEGLGAVLFSSQYKRSPPQFRLSFLYLILNDTCTIYYVQCTSYFNIDSETVQSQSQMLSPRRRCEQSQSFVSGKFEFVGTKRLHGE